MGIRVELEMLAVLLFLTPVVIDGVAVTKCQLVKQLQLNAPNLDSVMMAKIVYQAEIVANFSTNFTMQVNPPIDSANSRVARSAKKSKPAAKPAAKAPAKAPVKPAIASPPNATQINVTQMAAMMNQTAPVNSSHSNDQINMTQMAAMMNQTAPVNSSHSDDQMAPPFNGSQKWTLYSMFLFPDTVACTAPNVSSFNVCNTTCDMLLSNDTTSAIKCLGTMYNITQSNNNTGPGQGGAANVMNYLFSQFRQSFPNLNSTAYLADCPKP